MLTVIENEEVKIRAALIIRGAELNINLSSLIRVCLFIHIRLQVA